MSPRKNTAPYNPRSAEFVRDNFDRIRMTVESAAKINGSFAARQIDELVSDVCFRLLHVSTFPAEEPKQNAFIRRMVNNLVSRKIVKLNRREDILRTKKASEPPALSAVEQNINTKMELSHVQAALNRARLPPREKVILTLMLEGYSTQQIREKLGVAPTTVRTLIARIRKKVGAQYPRRL